MRHPRPIIGLILVLLLPIPGAAAAQAADTLRLGLANALARARERHPAVLQAAAERRARDADVLATAAAFLPRVSGELGLVRSNDPVAVFGGRLRQGRFGQSDFALDALNRPAPLTDVSTALTVEQPLFQPEALLARRAGLAAARAAALGEARAGQAAAFDAIRAYFATRLSEERVTVLTEALDVARRILAQVRALHRGGTVTIVDEQLARARVSEVEANLANAEAGRLAAGDLLLTLLGQAPGRPVVATDALAAPTPGADTVAAAPRDDIAALEAVVAAMDANVARAKGSWIPSAGAFGSLDWHAGRGVLAAGPHRWTAGLMMRWTPFRGLADVGQLRRSEAERDGARAAALASVDAADAALAGAAQAARVAGVRYAEGMATITELLAVRAAESAQRLARLNALYQARVADAALQLALGRLPE